MTDLLVVRFLHQLTSDSTRPLEWRESEQCGYQTRLNEVRVSFQEVPEMGGSRLFLTLSYAEEDIHIAEPRMISLFGGRYRSEEDRETAALLKNLGRLISRQRAARQELRRQRTGVLRQSILRRLMFGPPAHPGDC
jgi:hypothetical protein